MIWAEDESSGIGFENKIPWYIPEDFKHFKELTSGNTIIMGSKTWDSLPKKPLPNRHNIILTHNSEKQKPSYKKQFLDSQNVQFTTFVDLNLNEMKASDQKYFIIGGSQIYQLFINYADELIVTKVEGTYQVDTFAPPIDLSTFQLTDTKQNKGWKVETYRRFK